MSLLALAAALAPQLQGVEGDEPRTALWPVGSGFAPYQLRCTYGQAEGDESIRLHLGLDVTDVPVGQTVRHRTVYALEDGTVRRVHVDEGHNYQSGLVVESKAKPGRAWLYLHLEKDSIQFAEGEEVRINQILGDVLLVDNATGVPHVHLSRIGGDFVNQGWTQMTQLNERNPLALFRPEALGDSKPPVIAEIGGECLHVEDDDAVEASGPAGGDPHLPRDVRACVHDEDGGPYALAPYKLQLIITGVQPRTFRVCLDGPLPDTETLYARRKRAPGEYDVFAVLTNGAEDCGSSLARANAWQPAPGQNHLELIVEDVAGKKTTAVRDIPIPP